MFSAQNSQVASSAANYIEDVFSTYLYTGTGSSQTITNNIDLSTYGGLVWNKLRNNGTAYHYWVDTARGRSSGIGSNSTDAQYISSAGNDLASFTTTGYTLGPVQNWNASNSNGGTIVSWAFRKQAKFFDVVTYTGNNASNRAISHNLGSTPGFILVKATSTTGDWYALHRVGNSGSWGVGTLNSTNTFVAPNPSFWGNGTTFTAPTSTTFTVSADGGSLTNGSGITFVAYLFAHNAGGFGPAGADNVISCGSFTPSSGTATVTLGYEPQFVILKNSSASENWIMLDTMRGWVATAGGERILNPNLSDAESAGNLGNPTATGFETANLGTGTYIYIAIRRGPMKTPTSGTQAYTNLIRTGNGTSATLTGFGFPPDAVLSSVRNDAWGSSWNDKLRNATSDTYAAGAETSNSSDIINVYGQNGITLGSHSTVNASGKNYVHNAFRRAPGFFDVVCYTGTGSATTQTHNLGAAPELLIVKSRDTAVNWVVWASAPTPQQNQYALNLNTAGTWGSSGDKIWGATLTGAPNMTSTTFSLGDYVGVNGSAKTYVAYLFATVVGVSKVGSYTGNGSSQTINCGFAAGARFVLIKRTDSTGNWVTFDTARGIVSGNDPALYLNSSAAEVTGIDAIDPDNSGFIVNQETTFNLNVNAATYIFLAVS